PYHLSLSSLARAGHREHEPRALEGCCESRLAPRAQVLRHVRGLVHVEELEETGPRFERESLRLQRELGERSLLHAALADELQQQAVTDRRERELIVQDVVDREVHRDRERLARVRTERAVALERRAHRNLVELRREELLVRQIDRERA